MFIVIFSNFNLLSLLPVFFLCAFFYLWNKKNYDKNSKLNKKGKDDLWHIVKEYLKLNNRSGCEIIDLTLNLRPEKKELNKYIYKSKIAAAKEEARVNKTQYVKPKQLERYEVEDYFDNLEKQTNECKGDFYLHDENINSKRKRYVVCFKVKEKGLESPDWEAIEIELFKDHRSNDDSKYQVSFNKSLNYKQELEWLFPMQISYLEDKLNKERQKDKKKINSSLEKNKKNKFLSYFVKQKENNSK